MNDLNRQLSYSWAQGHLSPQFVVTMQSLAPPGFKEEGVMSAVAKIPSFFHHVSIASALVLG